MLRSLGGWLLDTAAAAIALIADTRMRRERDRYQQQCYLDALRDAGRGC